MCHKTVDCSNPLFQFNLFISCCPKGLHCGSYFGPYHVAGIATGVRALLASLELKLFLACGSFKPIVSIQPIHMFLAKRSLLQKLLLPPSWWGYSKRKTSHAHLQHISTEERSARRLDPSAGQPLLRRFLVDCKY